MLTFGMLVLIVFRAGDVNAHVVCFGGVRSCGGCGGVVPIRVHTHTGGALGHPKVFINLDEVGVPVDCKYCGLRFQLEPHH